MLPDFELCCKIFEKNDLKLSEELYKKLDIYAEILIDYNKKVNLTAITEPMEILVKHFVDSIKVAEILDIPLNANLIDVGTGAGFPSVPLKLYRPDIKITLLDSLQKRITFLELLCLRLEISSELIHGRAENISKMTEYREKFDFVTARAVANISLLSELCIPFLKIGGIFAALKGPNEDINSGNKAIEVLGGNLEDIIRYEIDNELRRIAVIKKISQTSAKYPRNSAQLKRNPL